MHHRPRVVMSSALAQELLKPNPVTLTTLYNGKDEEEKAVSIKKVKLYDGQNYYLVIDTVNEQIIVTKTIEVENGLGGSSSST